MHHLWSASLFHQDVDGRHPMGHVTGHDSFLRGGWIVLPVKVVDHSRQFCFTHCHIVVSSVYLAVRKTLPPFVIDNGIAPVLQQSL